MLINLIIHNHAQWKIEHTHRYMDCSPLPVGTHSKWRPDTIYDMLHLRECIHMLPFGRGIWAESSCCCRVSEIHNFAMISVNGRLRWLLLIFIYVAAAVSDVQNVQSLPYSSCSQSEKVASTVTINPDDSNAVDDQSCYPKLKEDGLAKLNPCKTLDFALQLKSHLQNVIFFLISPNATCTMVGVKIKGTACSVYHINHWQLCGHGIWQLYS